VDRGLVDCRLIRANLYKGVAVDVGRCGWLSETTCLQCLEVLARVELPPVKSDAEPCANQGKQLIPT